MTDLLLIQRRRDETILIKVNSAAGLAWINANLAVKGYNVTTTIEVRGDSSDIDELVSMMKASNIDVEVG